MDPVAPNRRPLLALQTATLLSWLGDAMAGIALPWFVLQTTGSVTQTGFSVVARTVGVYVATVLSGPYVDRFPTRPLVATTYALAAMAMLTTPVLWWKDALSSWVVFLGVFVTSVSQRPGFLALNRSLPEIADRAGVTVERASGLNEMVYQASLLAGPPIAGILIAAAGSAWVLAIDALSFVLAAALVVTGIPGDLTGPRRTASPAPASWSYRARMQEGIVFLRQDAVLVAMMFSVAFGILLVNAPLLSVILQVHARQSLDSAITLGFLFTSFAIGALIGAGTFTWLAARILGRTLWIAAYLLTGAPYVAIVLDAPPSILAATLGIFGFAEGLSTPMYAAMRFRRVPQALRGRVFSALSPVTGLAPSLGLMLATFLLKPLGVHGVAVVLLLGVAGFGLWLIQSPAIAHLSNRDIPSQGR